MCDPSPLSRWVISWESGEAEKLSKDELFKAGVSAGTDPESLHGFGQGQEGALEPPSLFINSSGHTPENGGRA